MQEVVWEEHAALCQGWAGESLEGHTVLLMCVSGLLGRAHSDHPDEGTPPDRVRTKVIGAMLSHWLVVYQKNISCVCVS